MGVVGRRRLRQPAESTARRAAQGVACGYYGYPPYRYPLVARPGCVSVKPNKAQVCVDGYYAGIVDDFDEVFQRLHTSPGAHDRAA